jgi:hypothetical protein
MGKNATTKNDEAGATAGRMARRSDQDVVRGWGRVRSDGEYEGDITRAVRPRRGGDHASTNPPTSS